MDFISIKNLFRLKYVSAFLYERLLFIICSLDSGDEGRAGWGEVRVPKFTLYTHSNNHPCG